MNTRNSKLILHIDDEESIRLSIQGFLEDYNFEVVTAENGKIGLEKFKKVSPDLVLVDLRMPEVDGLDVLGEVSKSSPEIPIIVISGTGVIGDVIEALRLGAWNYILKPIQDMSVLLHAVEGALERAALMRENRDYQENLEKRVIEQTKILRKKNIELKSSEEFFRSLIENSNDIILILDNADKIIYASPSFTKILGYSREKSLKNNFFKLIHPEDNRVLKDKFVNVKTIPGQLTNLTFKFKDSNSTWHYLEGTAINLVHLSSVNGIVLNCRDITEKQVLQQQLSQAQRMESIGTLAGGIAHDFNNLLTVINGFSDFALMKLKEKDPFYKEISAIRSAGEKASNLTRQILAFSRRQIIQPKIISVNQVITELDKMIHRLIGEDIKFDVNLYPEAPNIKADPGQIEQILINLVVNARDAINQKTEKASEKKISIETDKIFLDDNYIKTRMGYSTGLYVSITVSDSGIGISDEIKQKIFEPFFTSKEKGKGTGLGLSTVYGIVKQNNGNIYVDSKSGIGSTFIIFWPATDQELSNTKPIKKLDSDFTGNETILLVEDDKQVSNFTSATLTDFGYKVYCAENGKQALQLVKDQKLNLNLLFTDMVMPDMNGKELSEKLKKFYPDINILFVSGYVDNIVSESGEVDRNINFLQKPYSVNTLLKKVREILN